MFTAIVIISRRHPLPLLVDYLAYAMMLLDTSWLRACQSIAVAALSGHRRELHQSVILSCLVLLLLVLEDSWVVESLVALYPSIICMFLVTFRLYDNHFLLLLAIVGRLFHKIRVLCWGETA